MIILAMDRAISVRTRDKFARLHVSSSRIAKACVSPYYGHEIPGWEALGLAADQVYQMFRDPAELEKAASSFNRVPLLHVHVPVHANAPKMEAVIGTVGSECAFDGEFLTNSLGFWTQDGIDLLEHYGQSQLSPSYSYDPDMTPGMFKGIAFDGVMRNIHANHVALVTKGRQGPDVVVGDASMKNKVAAVKLGLLGHVMPMLAQDAKLDLSPVFEGVTSANIGKRRAKIVEMVIAAATPSLAQDAALDEAVLGGVIDGSLALAKDEADDEPAPNPVVAPVITPAEPKAGDPALPAMDEDTVNRLIDAAVSKARTETTADITSRMNAMHAARTEVAPLVGDVVAMDSADAVYIFALDHVGIKADTLTGTPTAGLKAMVAREVDRAKPAPRLAADAAPTDTSQSTALGFTPSALVRV